MGDDTALEVRVIIEALMEARDRLSYHHDLCVNSEQHAAATAYQDALREIDLILAGKFHRSAMNPRPEPVLAAGRPVHGDVWENLRQSHWSLSKRIWTALWAVLMCYVIGTIGMRLLT